MVQENKNPLLFWSTKEVSLVKTNPNFDTNAPPFEVRGCKVILGGAFLRKGGANKLLQIIGCTIKLHFIIFVVFL